MNELSTNLVPQLVNVGINIDKDDVAAILMARAESLIKNNITTCQATDKKLSAVTRTLNEELQAEITKATETAATKTRELLEAAAKEMDCKHIEHEIACLSADSVKCTLDYKLTVRGSRPQIHWTVCSATKAPAAVKASWRSLKENANSVKDNNNVWLDWRRKLQDLPSMERRAKAAVAEARLNKSAEGQELLALLEGRLDDSIKMLGIG